MLSMLVALRNELAMRPDSVTALGLVTIDHRYRTLLHSNIAVKQEGLR
jgi:hypothetical protein